MEIIDFRKNQDQAISILEQEMQKFFTLETLVINDTRGMIIPSVLPHIEFVGTYDQRIYPLLKNTNVIFSTPFCEEITQYYKNFSLVENVSVMCIENKKEITLAKNILGNDSILQQIKNLGIKKIIPFFVNDDMPDLSQKLGIPLCVDQEIFNKANNKTLLKQYLEKTNFPTLFGTYTSDKNILEKYFQDQKRYLFKDPLGVSGYGFWDNKENSFSELLDNYAGKELIIEEFLDKKSSPSVQFFIGEKASIIFGMTDQILENGKIYVGNSSPSEFLHDMIGDELIRQSKHIIDYIEKLGYTGFGGIDFLVGNDNSVYATEVNARFTGATYPAITALFLKGNLLSQWEFVNFEGEKSSLKNYLSNDVIQNKEEAGIFPLGISGLEKYGKINVLKIIE